MNVVKQGHNLSRCPLRRLRSRFDYRFGSLPGCRHRGCHCQDERGRGWVAPAPASVAVTAPCLLSVRSFLRSLSCQIRRSVAMPQWPVHGQVGTTLRRPPPPRFARFAYFLCTLFRFASISAIALASWTRHTSQHIKLWVVMLGASEKKKLLLKSTSPTTPIPAAWGTWTSTRQSSSLSSVLSVLCVLLRD
jgi:hypothetical protein